MPRPSVATLYDSGEYRLVESFTIDEMPQFLAREAGFARVPLAGQPEKKATPKWVPIAVLFVLGAGFGALLGLSIKGMVSPPLLPLGWQLVLGVVGLFLVILPVHEGIHALFFKILGARKVGFGYSKKGLMVYAYAQRFVMSLPENALVAAMPFLLISLLLFICWVGVPGLKATWMIIFLLHMLGCMGDFILIGHAWKNRKKAMFTYDDLDEKRTYFFERQ
ncbi:DUF3267 domain-containing protein [Salmonirosea aquatica]|uniref:DUF3267 domain-containing protein n=1 Tax=Salmonirosea aquatica TaxID=2654236 RepID=A0A7C9BG97_9BACT|nr:hypothetical protein [Cytophagaceae bacterium SJW1-29]